jgi:hypothetical protein
MNFQRSAGNLLGSDLEILIGNGRRQNLGSSISEGVSGVFGRGGTSGLQGLRQYIMTILAEETAATGCQVTDCGLCLHCDKTCIRSWVCQHSYS